MGPKIAVFVATRPSQVPDGCRRFVSVDGAVPGAAVVWDHHATGESINLDAMPASVDPRMYDGVATTLADTDAAVSAAVVLLGGAARIDPGVVDVLRSASYWCDHLAPLPGLDGAANDRGRALDRYVSQALTASAADPTPAFAAVVAELVRRIDAGQPMPAGSAPEGRDLRIEGRLTEHDGVAVFDLRGGSGVAPEVAYAQTGQRVGLFVEDHRAGGIRYTVGVNPRVAGEVDLTPVLEALARAELAHGAPCLGEAPVAGNENWGGRRTVFGSPWNYGSRLTVEGVVEIIQEECGP